MSGATRIDYDGRRFRSVANTPNGEVGAGTLFRYRQQGDVVYGDYDGGGVRHGHFVARVDEAGGLDMRYHHVSDASGALMTGQCRSRLEILPDGRYRLHEEWRWTSGDLSAGRSTVEETRE